MSRENAATRKAREEREKIEAFAKVKAEHSERLMMLMSNYANLPGFSFTADADGEQTASLAFVFKTSEYIPGVWETEYHIPAELQTWDDYYELENAERVVSSYHVYVAEEDRKAQVRSEALAKLNKEERQLLGLEKS